MTLFCVVTWVNMDQFVAGVQEMWSQLMWVIVKTKIIQVEEILLTKTTLKDACWNGDSSVSGWGFWDARLLASLCVLATGLSHPLLSSAKPSASSSLINMSSVWQSPNSPVASQHLGLKHAFPCQASAGVSNLPRCRETGLSLCTSESG